MRFSDKTADTVAACVVSPSLSCGAARRQQRSDIAPSSPPRSAPALLRTRERPHPRRRCEPIAFLARPRDDCRVVKDFGDFSEIQMSQYVTDWGVWHDPHFVESRFLAMSRAHVYGHFNDWWSPSAEWNLRVLR